MTTTLTNCPKCHSPVMGEKDACTQCGIFFNKWKEREENVAAGNMGCYTTLANATSAEFNWIILALVCLAVLGIFYWVGRDEFFPH